MCFLVFLYYIRNLHISLNIRSPEKPSKWIYLYIPSGLYAGLQVPFQAHRLYVEELSSLGFVLFISIGLFISFMLIHLYFVQQKIKSNVGDFSRQSVKTARVTSYLFLFGFVLFAMTPFFI